jgi:organic hydroperoxide reductase OsmC/OhrA
VSNSRTEIAYSWSSCLKILALLVPREMKVEHSGGVKAMTDEQLEAGIEAIQRMLEARAPGDQAKVIEGVAEPAQEVEKVAKHET